MKTQIVVRPDGTGSLFVDGKDISRSVKGVRIEACPTEQPSQRLVVTLDLVGDVLATTDGDQIRLTGGLQDALLALGWTPPESDQAVTT